VLSVVMDPSECFSTRVLARHGESTRLVPQKEDSWSLAGEWEWGSLRQQHLIDLVQLMRVLMVVPLEIDFDFSTGVTSEGIAKTVLSWTRFFLC